MKAFDDILRDALDKMSVATAEGTEAHGDEFHSVHRVQIERLRRALQPRYLISPLEDSELKALFENVDGIVEATREEQHHLYERYSDAWKSSGQSYITTAGIFAGHAVVISLTPIKIGTRNIIFVTPTSNVVNHDMIRSWLVEKTKIYAPSFDFRISDATNAHNSIRG